MSQPFARALAMMAMISAAMRMDGAAKHTAMMNIGQYQSRGKGIGKVTYARSGTVAQQKRSSTKAKNRAKHKAACRR